MIHIDKEKNRFVLHTKQTTYAFEVNKHKHLEHLYYGHRVESDYLQTKIQNIYEFGSATSYEEKGYMPNHVLLEYSSYGKGDYREPMLHVELPDGSRTLDVKYIGHEIIKNYSLKGLPSFQKEETLKVTLEDEYLRVDLYYTVLYEEDSILRNMEITAKLPITIDKAMSMSLDFLPGNYEVVKLDGAWIRERYLSKHQLTKGTLRFDSKKGVSSSDHNPFVILKEKDANHEYGRAYGCALVYSGNFEANIETSPHDLVRVNLGINSFDFRYRLAIGETFVTPEVILTYSNQGLNQLSQNFHNSVNNFLLREEDKNKKRPILVNNWEATYFDFNEKKLLAIAKKAKKLGIELFCLDDGWFSKRNDDFSSLGDWHVNKKKLPSEVKGIAKKINKLGLDFGIWVEPEMVNEDSDLYRAHPDWVIKLPNKKPSLGRNQLILDLTNIEVREYLIKAMTEVFESGNITYVKWDMNRNFSDVFGNTLDIKDQGKFHHLYVLGLYEILETLRKRFPDILFESCSSGGNRFDLGMVHYMPQTWTSDNTDAYERMLIQEGTSLLYPLSSISNHVSGERSHQVFRHTPLESRFNVACFGVLGYELDLSALTPFETKVIQKQVAFYKEYRDVFLQGDFYRIKSIYEQNQAQYVVVSKDKSTALVLVFNTLLRPNDGVKTLRLDMLDDAKTYRIKTREQYLNIRTFGSLIKHIVKFLKVNSTLYNLVANRYLFKQNDIEFVKTGEELKHMDITLPLNFTGTGYEPGDGLLLLEDFGSRIFVIEEINNDE